MYGLCGNIGIGHVTAMEILGLFEGKEDWLNRFRLANDTLINRTYPQCVPEGIGGIRPKSQVFSIPEKKAE